MLSLPLSVELHPPHFCVCVGMQHATLGPTLYAAIVALLHAEGQTLATAALCKVVWPDEGLDTSAEPCVWRVAALVRRINAKLAEVGYHGRAEVDGANVRLG